MRAIIIIIIIIDEDHNHNHDNYDSNDWPHLIIITFITIIYVNSLIHFLNHHSPSS